MKQTLLSKGKLLLVPVLLILLGLVLMVNPDVASAAIARMLGWLILAGGIVTGIAALASHTGRLGKAVTAVLLAAAGIWLISHPLALAAWLGRFVGVLILINSGSDLYYACKHGRQILFHAIAAAVGVILILLPMTTSRLVFTLCGAVVLVIGIVMLVDRLRGRKRIDPPEDGPRIVDAL